MSVNLHMVCCSAAVHDRDCATWLIRTFTTLMKNSDWNYVPLNKF